MYVYNKNMNSLVQNATDSEGKAQRTMDEGFMFRFDTLSL